MKILHTSDWHLGRALYGKKRYSEFEQFLLWLEKTIINENIDALLVSGDIFDNSTPGNRAQELYYNFLCRVSLSNCRHIVITAGNHDSPSFLNAPREILKALNVHVSCSASDNPEDEVIVLENSDNIPEAVVCAVPYLRDRDIRTAEAGESIDDKNHKLIEGIKNHYRSVCDAAEKKRKESEDNGTGWIPVIAMGHLFTQGAETADGDGVRDLYVGSLAHVSESIFPSGIDYLALGHLHVPQTIAGNNTRRYSGSPVPMGYGEAEQVKKVITAEFREGSIDVTEISVPCFQKLERLSGDVAEILEKIDLLRFSNSSAWLEIVYTGNEVNSSLREIFDEAVEGTDMEIRRIKNTRVIQRIAERYNDEELADLDENDIFNRCLESSGIPDEERSGLLSAYSEILAELHEDDRNSE